MTARKAGTPTVVEFDPAATNLGAEAAKLKASKAEFVIVNGSLPVITQIIKAAAQLGYTPKWGTTWAGLDAQFAKLAGKQVDGSSYFATPFLDTDAPAAADYQAAMKQYQPKADPESLLALEGWTLAHACVTAIREASKAAGGKVPTSQQLLNAMNRLSIDDDLIQDLKWTASDHRGSPHTQILALKGGEFVPEKPFAAPVGDAAAGR